MPFRVRRVVLSLLVLLPLTAPTPAEPPPHLGFLPASSEAQAKGEAAFLATPTPQQAERWLRKLTEEPHVAGTPQDRAVAEFVRDKWREFGIDADLVTYDVLLNYPKKVGLRLVEPAAQEISLFEDGYLRDKDSFSHDAFPAFHGYGASGKAAAQVVYANYGSEEDFKKLEEMGVDVRGRIVLVRYGKVFRGLKVEEAQRRGAAAVVIYSDPADDGYMRGDIYPDGPMRPPTSLQRGSVQFLSLGPGDPQTPGQPSKPGAERIPREKLEGIPKIPSLPISYGEAEKILRAIAGPNVPDGWQGGLPFAYHVGPGPAKLEMEVEMDYAVRPIWDVIGRIRGSAEPDRWVVAGNHIDAWTYGAVDPNSGTASFLEMVRGLGAALKAGWRPRRTIVLAAWDGEEYGLLGSTEWGEDLAADLAGKAVAYLNMDSSVTGPDLSAGGVPSLRDLLLEVTGDLMDPKRGKSVAELWTAARHRAWNREEPIPLDRPDPAFEPQMEPLGSGSDYTVFLDHLGVTAMNVSFTGPYGVYHSTLDDLFWMEKFGDPEFLYHALAARTLGLLVMRLAGADLVPLRYAPYAAELSDELDDLRRCAVSERRAAAVAEKPPARPPLEADFGPVVAALDEFAQAARTLDGALDAVALSSAGPGSAPGLNDAVVRVERTLLAPAGISGRPWFRHLLYAPGLTTGYAAWPFPELTQAVKDHDPALWQGGSQRVIGALHAASAALRDAAALAR
jgi:N-acetylated-alpha-linked acidic dipeptidase